MQIKEARNKIVNFIGDWRDLNMKLLFW